MALPPFDRQRLKEVFADARALPAAERQAYLSAACAGNEALRQEVESLLSSDDRATSFLESPAVVWSDGTPHPAQLRIEGRRIGVYQVQKLLGAGGMGEVYRAHDSTLHRDVALKVLPSAFEFDQDRLARLRREAQVLAALNHPHIAAIYGLEESNGHQALVLELVEGVTLANRIADGPLPFADALTMAHQIAQALQAAHEKGIIHRDLKPANIKVTPAGVVKVLDFGLAKTAAGDLQGTNAVASPTVAGETQAGAVLGTAAYMSPEQARGQEVDARTDVWAFGCVLFEMLAGRRAFAGETAAQSVARSVEQEPDWSLLPTATPAPIRRLLRQCLQKDRRQRLQSMVEAHVVIEQQLARRALSRRTWMALGAAALLVVSMGAYLWSRFDRESVAGRSDEVHRSNQDPVTAPSSPQRITLVVLPFANQSGDSAQDYLSDGLSDELITELSRLHPERLGVIARTTAVRYHQTRADLSQIGRELGVDYFIEGSAARVGGRVRVAVRLAHASDQTQVWAERYERDVHDLLAVQAEIARSIANRISVALTPEQAARLDSRTPIDPEAYERYLKGRYFLEKRTEQGLKRAVADFDAAVKRQPRLAAAYAGIASSYVLLAYYGHVSPDEAIPRARAASLKALELDDQLPEAHISLAGIYAGYDRRRGDAEEAYRAALRLDPGHPMANQWYANLLVGLGRHQEAQAHILRARQGDPLSLIIQVNVANIYLLSRQYDRAIAECRKAIEMEEHFVVARWVLGRAQELKGEYLAAVDEFERALQREPESTLLRAALARTYALSGERTRANEILQTLKVVSRQRYVSPLDLASVHVALRHHDEAFALLEQAVRDRANLLIYLKVDPAFDSLRGDPRFRRILAMIGLD